MIESCCSLFGGGSAKEVDSYSDDDDDTTTINDTTIDDAAKYYKKRPKRHGMYFLVHKDLLPKIHFQEEEEDPINVYDSFFCCHPNGIKYTTDFYAVKLNKTQIDHQHTDILVASYKWLQEKGVGKDGKEYKAPKNYKWFMDEIKHQQKIGWIDFVSNVVVNVSSDETIDYMGQLYSKRIVSAGWLKDPTSLSTAMKRGWIFQESAFSTLDDTPVDSLLQDYRNLGMAYRKSGNQKSCEELFKSCRDLATLLMRRGIGGSGSFPTTTILGSRRGRFYHTCNGGNGNWANGLIKLLRERRIDASPGTEEVEASIIEQCDAKHGGRLYSVLLCVDLFTMTNDEYEMSILIFKSRLCHPMSADCTTAASFLGTFGISILRAYLACIVSYEEDREIAITTVPRVILRDLGMEISSKDLIREMWKRQTDGIEKGKWYFASEVNAKLLNNPFGMERLQLGGTFVKPVINVSDTFQYQYQDINGDIAQVEELTNSPRKKRLLIIPAVRNNMAMRVAGAEFVSDLVGTSSRKSKIMQRDGIDVFQSAGFNGDGSEVHFLYCTPPPADQGGLNLDVVMVASKEGRIFSLYMTAKRKELKYPKREFIFYEEE